MRQRGAATAHVSQRLAVEPLHEPVVVECLDVAANRGRSVVDEDIEAAECLDWRCDRSPAPCSGEEVGRYCLCLNALCNDLRFRLRKRCFVAAADGDVRTFPCESQRDRETNAPVATGHQHRSTLQTKVHALCPLIVARVAEVIIAS